jgi:hypothetical protein
MRKQKKMLGTLVGLVLIFVGNLVAAGGGGGLDNPLLDLGVGARALSMGRCFVAIADDLTAGYWNPAGLGKIKRKGINSMFTQLFETTNYYCLGYTQTWRGKGISINWLMITSNDIINTEVFLDEEGNYVLDENENVKYVVNNDYDYIGQGILVSYGQLVADKVSLGGSMKLIYKTQKGISGFGIGIDGGVLYQFRPDISLGVVIQDLTITRIKWETQGKDAIYPNLKIGVAYGMCPVEGGEYYSITLSLEIEQRIVANYHPEWHLGGEWWLTEELGVRIGYDEPSGICAGVGFRKEFLLFDYGYITHPELKNTHRLSLGIEF